ncbi:DUF3368 domain-containing protein [Methanoculleus sp. FWC-SCC1]|uniref:DUF3368 domain-containing protein n=1 Tax=Methanoculleus frigidifontis TaxID=2584085 RepID=A0ABT8MCL7_9EURY|nr:DUF3368 domain-containing protein [Methanoculleus sp. FWC-SCC1]MDN7025674.1 DUF3368 domain-containing protein [Methanoculleus sp. FWC-SCC1]
MDVVSNSTPLIALAKIQKLNLLKHFFGTVSIPQEVYDEVVTRGGPLYGADEVSQASWIRVVSVENRTAVDALSLNLDRGEAEAIVLAREIGALLIIDDRDGRNAAASLGVPITGTIGVLLLAAEDGMITFGDELDALVAAGFRLSEREYRRILDLAGKR